MIDPNKLCPGCMNEWTDRQSPCPVCGFTLKGYEKPARWLPLKTVLDGKYMIGKAIGEGGFGITYLGWDLNLQVKVAIKEYFPIGLATRETGRGRSNAISTLPGARRDNYKQGLEKFMTEAKNLSKFYNLHGIVAVRDFFFENETAYMVMEFVDGITLGTHLKEHGGQISEQEALKLFHPVMESLKVVHQSGIIHRDISPDNIMMTKDGKIKLIDFGAARFAGGDTEKSLTIILKHGYAPAEQYQSRGNQGPWTDVYAICATMYRMITGKVPPSAMDRLHEDTLQEFTELGCNVSVKTAYALIDKGMAIRVQDRYQNMEELIQGLYGVDAGKVRRKKKENKNAKLALALGIGGAAACFVIGVGAWAVMNSNRPAASYQGGSSNQGQTGIQGESSQDTDNTPNRTNNENNSQIFQNQKDYMAKNKEELSKITQEEVTEAREAAKKAEKRLSAGGSHLVFVRDDGSVRGGGTNYNDELGVNKWSDMEAVSTGKEHTVGLKSDGTVVAVGSSNDGKCAVDIWKNIVQVAAGGTMSLGLKNDGTVVAAGSNNYGQCDTSEWTDIQAIAAGDAHSLGLKKDGTVVTVGNDSSGQRQVKDWTDIVNIAASDNFSAGLKSDGTVVLAGMTDGMEAALEWQKVVSVTAGSGYVAGLLANNQVVVAGDSTYNQNDAFGWENITAIAAGDETLFGIKEDGTIVRTSYVTGTSDIEEWNDIKKAVSGGGYLLGLKKDGTVESWGLSGGGQGQAAVGDWRNVVDIAAGKDGSLGLKEDGTVLVGGTAFEEASGWTGITQVAVTDGLAVGLKEDGTIVTCGEMKDRYKFDPETWNNITQITAGTGGTVVGMKESGTVVGMNIYNLNDLNDVISLSVSDGHVAAVQSNGTVLVSGSGSGGYGNVYSWRDVTQVATGTAHTVGLRSDGTVLAAGSNTNGQCDVSDWTDIAYIAAGDYVTVGIKTDGTVLVAGKVAGGF